MRRKVIRADGKELLVNGCIGCALNKGSIEVVGGVIVETDYFAVEQDLEIPIPGFFIIRSKRHIVGFNDFSKEESVDFINLLVRVRVAMKNGLGIDKISVIQEEKSKDHFHLWLFPWYKWMKKYKTKLSSIKTIMNEAKGNRANRDNLDDIQNSISKVKKILHRVK